MWKGYRDVAQMLRRNMVFNEEENQFECYMGPNCGYLPLDDLKCEECCKN